MGWDAPAARLDLGELDFDRAHQHAARYALVNKVAEFVLRAKTAYLGAPTSHMRSVSRSCRNSTTRDVPAARLDVGEVEFDRVDQHADSNQREDKFSAAVGGGAQPPCAGLPRLHENAHLPRTPLEPWT